jgi:hypothetical protein
VILILLTTKTWSFGSELQNWKVEVCGEKGACVLHIPTIQTLAEVQILICTYKVCIYSMSDDLTLNLLNDGPVYFPKIIVSDLLKVMPYPPASHSPPPSSYVTNVHNGMQY